MEITNGQPWQKSSQNSEFWRGAECHCQVAALLVRGFSSKLEFFADFLYKCVISLTGRKIWVGGRVSEPKNTVRVARPKPIVQI
jgi:hypothetical protein